MNNNSPVNFFDIDQVLSYFDCNPNIYLELTKNADKLYENFIIQGKKKLRIISSPTYELKKVQKNISLFLENIYNIPYCVHSFVKNKNIITNAKVHICKKKIVKLDLKDFFNLLLSA